MCESGAISTTCTPLEVPHPNEYNHRHVYELDARHPSMDDIKMKLHAEFLGETLLLLHKLDLDFCKKDTLLLGAIPNADERNITWYLLTDKNIPSRSCELSGNCIRSVTSSGGFVTMHKTKLIPGANYYICASSNRTVVHRELFDDILEEINECGNGFLIDDAPPIAGQVKVINQNQGFMSSQNEMVISWKGFKDRLSLSHSNFSSPVYSYNYAIGTTPGSIDVLPFSSAGLSHSIEVRGLHLQNGVKYYATVRAMDHVNLSAEAISAAVDVDFTPPDVGTITVGGALRHKYIMATEHLNVYWKGFEDKESGIRHYYLGIGDQPDTDNILPFRIITEQYADLSRNEFQDGFKYYAVLKVMNKAGQWTTVSSDPFILDSSPPQRGVVRDGSSVQSSDVDYQNFTSSLTCHWEAFDDPHSGIQFYRVGLGTDPEQFDTYMLTEVGLRTEITWRTHLKAGEKYFATVEACNGATLCTRQHSDGIILDDSPPIQGHIHVGISGKHENYQSHRNSISAHWVGFEDPQSDIHHFEWCVTLHRNTCDIFPFANILLSQSGFKTQLNLPLGQNIFIRIKAYNNVGMYTEATSDSFKVDNSHPVLVKRPKFVLKNMQISHQDQTQWENSLVRLEWKFSDPDSPIVKHVVRLNTHHDGKVREEITQLGNEDKVTVQMSEHDLLLNGDRYWATVTACNAAGICTNSTSEDLLIDSSPPHLGGFQPPMTWVNEGNVSRIYLSWYGFSDVESNIVNYMITVSRHYSGSELSNGVVEILPKNKTVESSYILLHNTISEEDTFILSIWAVNGVGLRSEIGKVTVTAVQTDTKGSKGILKLQKHSCVTYYCNRDCTCAVVGEKCEQHVKNLTCVTAENKPEYQNIRVLVGMLKNHQAVTASSSCISAHWILEKNETKVPIQRFEWSIGTDKPGGGIFEGPLAKKWFDVDLQTNLTFCMPANRQLVNGENYTIYIKAWYSERESHMFSSPPVTIDTTPPDIVRGKYVYVSTDDCVTDVYFITNTTSIHVCWRKVFKDRISGILKNFVMAGTSPYGDDLIPVTDYGLAEKAEFNDLPISPGTKYYFTIRVLNSVGLMTSLASDGIVLDEEPPFEGVVFNTDHHKNVKFQASLSIIGVSWHGFVDHHSHIHHYSVFVTEVATGRVVQFDENVGIRTSITLNNTNLHHGESYKVSVQASDAAGYATSVIDSETVTVDSTAPQSFTCRAFTGTSQQSNLTFGSNDISFTSVLSKDRFYKLKVGLESLDYFSSVQISIGHHMMVLQMSENADHSKETEMSFLSPYNDSTDFTINFNDPVKSNDIRIRLLECSDIDLEATVSPIDVMQFSHSQISVCSRILDLESGVRSIEVGVGTVEGGFQVHPLTPVPLENHVVIEHNSPHGTKLYVTAIARNHAGLWTAFGSNEIVVDHTPPRIFNIKAKMKLYQFENTTEERTAHVTISGNIQDKESGIKTCTCNIEL
ncbi:uncharacterized protein LOC123539831 [Mercenaria mercenaria]|uniref:uncharacterized protein LOC123539831 n=1 Tax=Mercenaria mercenaria TaxID=6596 RepID=UPI00234F6B85|nr:uncharacterized protein LOC123539831 [Mercenaria mercenaria]